MVRMDLVHDLDRNVIGVDSGLEHVLESGVAEHFLPAPRPGQHVGETRESALVVTRACCENRDGDEQAETVDDPEAFTARDPLAGVVSPARRRDGGGAAYAASVDDTYRRFGVVSLVDADSFAEAVGDLLPCAVTAPGDMVAVNGVPVRVAGGQSPPLASRRCHEHDRVYYVAFGMYWRPAHLPVTEIVRHEIGDENPLGVR